MRRTLLLPVAEAAERLGVSIVTLYRWINRGQVQAIRRGGRLRVVLLEIYPPGSEAPVYVANEREADALLAKG